MVKKRKWTHESAIEWICKVNRGKEKYGLKYASACQYLRIAPAAAALLFK